MKLVALVLLVCAAGCAPAPTLRPDQLSQEPPEKRFVVRAASGEWTVDSLRVEQDTLRGSIIALHPSASREPLALPLASVVALRYDRATANGIAGTLVPIAFILGFAAFMSAAWGSD